MLLGSSAFLPSRLPLKQLTLSLERKVGGHFIHLKRHNRCMLQQSVLLMACALLGSVAIIDRAWLFLCMLRFAS